MTANLVLLHSNTHCFALYVLFIQCNHQYTFLIITNQHRETLNIVNKIQIILKAAFSCEIYNPSF